MTIQLLVVVELVEVFLVFSQDRILQRCGTDPLTFLLVEIFKVFNVARVQQRLWIRSPCPQIQVKVFKIFHRSRVPQPLLRFLLDTLGKGFFGLFSGTKKVRRSPGRWMKICFRTSAHPLRRLMAVTTPGLWSCPLMRSSTFGTVTLGRLLGGCQMVGSLAGSCTPMAPMYISSPRWCTSPLTSFDQWCVVSVLGAAQVHLSWPCELGADQVRVHGLADSVRDGVLLVGLVVVVEVLQSCSSVQQSMSYVFCASSQFLRQSGGHSSWLPRW